MYTEAEFFAKYTAARYKNIDLVEGKAWIHIGDTTNYYSRNVDGSWDNYDCRTTYS